MTLRKVLLLGILLATGFAASCKADDTKPAAASAVKIDVKAALAPRSLGDPKAPVKLDEYASLGCSHCAAFSNETFPKLETDYIDTGKVYYTFHDFPLNAPALTAAMVARCLPPEHYYQFIKFLFQTQDKWAFSEHFADNLRQNSKLVGFDDATFDACVNNQELKQGIVAGIEDATKVHKIQATPTFILNDKVSFSGALPYAAFKAKIDPLVATSGYTPKGAQPK